MLDVDQMIIEFDKGLRTIFGAARSARPQPDAGVPEAPLSDAEKKHSAGLMRVNHTGEVCAQALYQGQALTSRNEEARQALLDAAQEETEHLAWCESRLRELGSHTSFLNPLWYTGSLAIGAAFGLMGDKWNLGFLAETERQVEVHLDGHLDTLPEQDAKSRAIVDRMKEDEVRHAETAVAHGGAPLPEAIRQGMKIASRVMTTVAYRI